jgi:hypothetical protein
MTEVQKVLLRETAQMLDTAAADITDRLVMAYVGPGSTRSRHTLVEKRAVLYRLVKDMRALADRGTWA